MKRSTLGRHDRKMREGRRQTHEVATDSRPDLLVLCFLFLEFDIVEGPRTACSPYADSEKKKEQ